MYVILIVGDRTLVAAFQRQYQATEITVLAADSAEEGQEMLAVQHPDVVIVGLPGDGAVGLRALEAIHEQDVGVPVVLLAADHSSETAIEAMKLGAFDYMRKPAEFSRLCEVVQQALHIRHFAHVPSPSSVPAAPLVDLARALDGDKLVGCSPIMQEVYKSIGRVASQNVNVLIQGETGTGKELVARAIHRHSSRAEGCFLAVNCAAIPESLLESELFGHEKGAFTGAGHKRLGKFEQCCGGTLFLDEVGDMTPLTQSKVLRVLQDRRFERVGGRETINTDVRIIAATNRKLEQMIAAGQFRPDLYYRLNGFTIDLPPLRQRTEDIPALVGYFLACFGQELGEKVYEVPPETMDRLQHYSWPGNIRELRSVLQQALLSASGTILLPEFLPGALSGDGDPPLLERIVENGRSSTLDHFVEERLGAGSEDLYAESLAIMERLVLTRVLRHAQGNQSRAAKILGITRGSLRSKIRMQRITVNQMVGVEDRACQQQPWFSSRS